MTETYAQQLHRLHPNRPYVTWLTGELRDTIKTLSLVLNISHSQSVRDQLQELYQELYLRRG